MWKTFALDASRSFRSCMVNSASERAGNCIDLQMNMARARYGILGAVETVLDEANNSAYATSLRLFSRDMQRKAHGPTCTDRACCGCNAPSVFEPRHGRNESLMVERGQPSPFDRWWPLRAFRPLGTFCANARYSFFMHEPVHRAVSQLLLRCPEDNRTGGTCAPWAVQVIERIFARDLVLDTRDGGLGLAATPAMSNYVHRMLLGPRIFFARLHAVTAVHHRALLELLRRYALVLPVRALSNSSALITGALGWTSQLHMRHANRRTAFGAASTKAEAARRDEMEVVSQLSKPLRQHNKWDLKAYAWVEARFARDYAALTVGTPSAEVVG